MIISIYQLFFYRTLLFLINIISRKSTEIYYYNYFVSYKWRVIKVQNYLAILLSIPKFLSVYRNFFLDILYGIKVNNLDILIFSNSFKNFIHISLCVSTLCHWCVRRLDANLRMNYVVYAIYLRIMNIFTGTCLMRRGRSSHTFACTS